MDVDRKLLSEEKKRREAAENEKQELQDRLKAFEEERERQAKQLEETLSKTQELEQKAAVSAVPYKQLFWYRRLPMEKIP